MAAKIYTQCKILLIGQIRYIATQDQLVPMFHT